MPVIQFARTAQVCQVEDFPKKAERSGKGAMHVRPGRTATVTKAELEHLQACKIPLQVMRAEDPKPKDAKKEPQKAPQGAQGDGGSDAPASSPALPSGASGAPDGPSQGDGGGKRDKKRGK